jgi:O-antigen/teichoic acid export membrane protein
MFTRLQLRDIQATDARGEYRFSDYMALRLVATGLGVALIAAIALLWCHWEEVLVALAIAGARAAEGVSDVAYGLLQKSERLDLVSRSMMIKGLASLVGFAGMVYLTKSLIWGVVATMVACAALMVLYDMPNARRIMRSQGIVEKLDRASLWSGRLPALRRLAWLALPLGIVSLLDSLNVNVPRYIIQAHLQSAALGYFVAMTSVIVAGNIIVGALANSATPRLSRSYVHDIAGFTRLVWKLVKFGAILGGGFLLISLLLSRQLLTLAFTSDYARHPEVFIWLMVAAGLGYVARFLVYSMTAARQLKAQTPLYALTLGAIGGLSAWLIPAYGLLGAAWAVCGGMLVLLAGALAVNLHAIRKRSALAAPGEPQPSLPTDWA